MARHVALNPAPNFWSKRDLDKNFFKLYSLREKAVEGRKGGTFEKSILQISEFWIADVVKNVGVRARGSIWATPLSCYLHFTFPWQLSFYSWIWQRRNQIESLGEGGWRPFWKYYFFFLFFVDLLVGLLLSSYDFNEHFVYLVLEEQISELNCLKIEFFKQTYYCFLLDKLNWQQSFG